MDYTESQLRLQLRICKSKFALATLIAVGLAFALLANLFINYQLNQEVERLQRKEIIHENVRPDDYRKGSDDYNQVLDIGYSEGYSSGYRQGYEDGEAAGYEGGFEAGCEAGYDDGYEDGLHRLNE